VIHSLFVSILWNKNMKRDIPFCISLCKPFFLSARSMLPDDENVIIIGHVPVLQMIGEYELSGNVQFIPISGKGPMNFTIGKYQ
jgi:hypothetical protein